ncbi:unnamed protein product [Amoebophrya sp. A25]|nr:unnamed protein product [Amoebophrya sp. A25]|eukprot:GSA25T00017829001.1
MLRFLPTSTLLRVLRSFQLLAALVAASAEVRERGRLVAELAAARAYARLEERGEQGRQRNHETVSLSDAKEEPVSEELVNGGEFHERSGVGVRQQGSSSRRTDVEVESCPICSPQPSEDRRRGVASSVPVPAHHIRTSQLDVRQHAATPTFYQSRSPVSSPTPRSPAPPISPTPRPRTPKTTAHVKVANSGAHLQGSGSSGPLLHGFGTTTIVRESSPPGSPLVGGPASPPLAGPRILSSRYSCSGIGSLCGGASSSRRVGPVAVKSCSSSPQTSSRSPQPKPRVLEPSPRSFRTSTTVSGFGSTGGASSACRAGPSPSCSSSKTSGTEKMGNGTGPRVNPTNSVEQPPPDSNPHPVQVAFPTDSTNPAPDHHHVHPHQVVQAATTTSLSGATTATGSGTAQQGQHQSPLPTRMVSTAAAAPFLGNTFGCTTTHGSPVIASRHAFIASPRTPTDTHLQQAFNPCALPQHSCLASGLHSNQHQATVAQGPPQSPIFNARAISPPIAAYTSVLGQPMSMPVNANYASNAKNSIFPNPVVQQHHVDHHHRPRVVQQQPVYQSSWSRLGAQSPRGIFNLVESKNIVCDI